MLEAIKEYTHKNKMTPKLGAYDADYQLYTIETNYGKQYVKVPLADAPMFKSHFVSALFDGDYIVVKDSLRLAELRVKVNGKQFQSIKMTEDNVSTPINIELPDISLHLGNNNSTFSDEPISTAEKSIDTEIPITPVTNSNTFVVIIGNEKYQKVSEVPYASNDAHTFTLYCRKTLGIPAQNIRKYDNVTFGTMLAAMSDIKGISDAYEGNINVVFYYAGHGIPDESTNEAYLLPVDADGKYVEVCYPISRLYKELSELKARCVVVFMDACFSGTKRGEGMLISARSVAIKSKTQVPNGNVVVFSAATGDETAFSYNEKRHGMFTYYLLKKLQESGGNCSLGELGEYIRQKVRQKSILINRKSQTPTIQVSQLLRNNWMDIKLK